MRMGRLRERSARVTHVLRKGRSPGETIQKEARNHEVRNVEERSWVRKEEENSLETKAFEFLRILPTQPTLESYFNYHLLSLRI